MIVELRFPSDRPRRWMHALAERLGARHRVQLRWITADAPRPRGLESLLTLERMLLRRGRPSLADAAERGAEDRGERAEVVVDFTTAPLESGARVLRVLYDGAPGEDAALAAILSGDLPAIELRDETTGAILGRARPSAEAAEGLIGAMDAVAARVLTLIDAALDPQRPQLTEPGQAATRHAPPPAADYVLRGLAEALIRRIYRLVCYSPHWLLGWRKLSGGDGIWDSGDLSGAPWTAVPSPIHLFYADPFAATWQGRSFVLVEELNHHIGKGTISALEFGANGPTGRVVPALEEPWHLSYPFMIEDGGALWMIPESTERRDVALYRCVEFPHRWEREATLLEGVEFADATVVRHDGLYYMFGAARDGAGGYSDTLAIYWSEALRGPWRPHARNPVLIDRAAARPAGSFVRHGGRLKRPVQDCTRGYGAALALADIDELTPTAFRQTVRHVIAPGPLWPGRKLHTLNRCGAFEFIDGAIIQPRWTLAGGAAEPEPHTAAAILGDARR